MKTFNILFGFLFAFFSQLESSSNNAFIDKNVSDQTSNTVFTPVNNSSAQALKVTAETKKDGVSLYRTLILPAAGASLFLYFYFMGKRHGLHAAIAMHDPAKGLEFYLMRISSLITLHSCVQRAFSRFLLELRKKYREAGLSEPASLENVMSAITHRWGMYGYVD